MNSETSPATYERRDASVAVVLSIAGSTALGVALTLLVAALYYRNGYSARAHLGARQTSFTEGPTYRTSVMQKWPELEAVTRKHLDTYGWIDRTQGIVRIPIERAMNLLADEAAATRKDAKAQ